MRFPRATRLRPKQRLVTDDDGYCSLRDADATPLHGDEQVGAARRSRPHRQPDTHVGRCARAASTQPTDGPDAPARPKPTDFLCDGSPGQPPASSSAWITSTASAGVRHWRARGRTLRSCSGERCDVGCRSHRADVVGDPGGPVELRARAHARSGDPVEIAGYLGSSEVFDRAIAAFAESYADQNERDHAALVDAIATGRVQAKADA